MINRRALIRGLGGGALALGSGTLSRLVQAGAAEDRFLVVYWNAGGWDPTYVFDPHFDSSLIEGDAQAVESEIG